MEVLLYAEGLDKFVHSGSVMVPHLTTHSSYLVDQAAV